MTAGTWQLRKAPGDVKGLASVLGCPIPIAHILMARDIQTPADAHNFLNPSLEHYLDDPAAAPEQLLGMTQAVERIFAALRDSEPILIYGDYDVDGTTATVLLKTALERIALAIDPQRPAIVQYHVPHRIREGYGMRSSVLADAAASGIRLVISVDTGIRAAAEAKEARILGLDLVITDHHLPDGLVELPDCVSVVNPAQAGCAYPFKQLCGAAVAFKLTQALLNAAAPLTADAEAFRKKARKLLPSFLKIVGIATIADAVPLAGENRTIAALGLAGLANPVQPGLKRLIELARIPIDRAPTATEIAFRIAPRINAAGRMDVASDVVELFLTRDAAQAHGLAEKLDALNQERRDSEAAALARIEDQLAELHESHGAYPADCIVMDDPAWHRGVLGILASRVVDRTGRPALVITHADGVAHGSGRSITGFHLLDALLAIDCKDSSQPLFDRFGGHAHAVGFALSSDKLPDLRQRLSEYSGGLLSAEILTPSIRYDEEITFDNLDEHFLGWVDRLAPFGLGNPEPVFLTRQAVVTSPVRLIKETHACLELTQNTRRFSALGWSRSSIDWAAICSGLTPGTPVDILYKLRRNTGYRAGAIELELCALRTADASAFRVDVGEQRAAVSSNASILDPTR